MKRLFAAALVLSLAATALRAQEPPTPAKPTKEHEWLQQFVGEWEMESECTPPGAPAMKGKMTEKVKTLGGLWIISEGKVDIAGMKFDCLMQIGYSAEKKKYIGTWSDSMTPFLWQYEGSVDPTGKILTLEADGPSMTKPGKMTKYRDVNEFKSKDERHFSSYFQDDKGEWVKMMSGVAKRKK